MSRMDEAPPGPPEAPAAGPAERPTLLEISQISLAYGGVRALDRVSFRVAAGQIHGLIGPNGAGKTSLLNVLSGLVAPTDGRLRLAGEVIDGWPPHRRAAAGLTRTYQHIRLFAGLTALENVLVGQHVVRRPNLWQRLRLAASERREAVAARARAEQLLARVGLLERQAVVAGSLAYGEQRRLEIARALGAEPRLLLLDEPAAGMNSVEVEQLATIIGSLRGEGRTVLLVEHTMPLVMSLCDRITVLDFGRWLAEGSPAEISRDPAVISAYLGNDGAGERE